MLLPSEGAICTLEHPLGLVTAVLDDMYANARCRNHSGLPMALLGSNDV